MNNRMRKSRSSLVRLCNKKIIAVTLVFALLLSGCWSSRQLEELGIVMAVGLDKGEKDPVLFTAHIAKASDMQTPSASGGGSSDGKAYVNVSQEGISVFGIIRDLTHKLSRKLYFSHNQIIVIGEDMAKAGISYELDMFLRNYETRMNSLMVMARGTAKDMLEEEAELENLPGGHLVETLNTQRANSTIPIVNIREYSINMLSQATVPVVPIVELYQDKDKKKAKYSGSAIFKDGKKIGELNILQSRGLLWAHNKVKSGVMHVDAPGGQVTMEILHTKGKIKPYKKQDGTIAIRIPITTESIVASAETNADLSKEEIPTILEENMKRAIQEEVYSAISQANSLGVDIFGFSEFIFRKYPKEWEKMKPDWDALCSQLEVTVEPDVNLRGMGSLVQQIKPGGIGHENG